MHRKCIGGNKHCIPAILFSCSLCTPCSLTFGLFLSVLLQAFLPDLFSFFIFLIVRPKEIEIIIIIIICLSLSFNFFVVVLTMNKAAHEHHNWTQKNPAFSFWLKGLFGRISSSLTWGFVEASFCDPLFKALTSFSKFLIVSRISSTTATQKSQLFFCRRIRCGPEISHVHVHVPIKTSLFSVWLTNQAKALGKSLFSFGRAIIPSNNFLFCASSWLSLDSTAFVSPAACETLS